MCICSTVFEPLNFGLQKCFISHTALYLLYCWKLTQIKADTWHFNVVSIILFKMKFAEAQILKDICWRRLIFRLSKDRRWSLSLSLSLMFSCLMCMSTFSGKLYSQSVGVCVGVTVYYPPVYKCPAPRDIWDTSSHPLLSWWPLGRTHTWLTPW